MASTVGSIKVVLSAEIGQFTSDLGRAAGISERRMRQIQRTGQMAMRAVGYAAAAAAAATAALTAQQMHQVDALAKSSDQLGISTETLAAYGLRAQLTGTSIDVVTKAQTRLSRTIVDAVNGVQTYTDAFALVGLRAEELINLSPEQQMEAMADAISRIENPTVRSAAAMQLLGRSGTQLINFLRDGSAGLQSARQDAIDFGLAISRDAAAKVEMANDAMTRFKATGDGLGRTIAVVLSPYIAAIADHFTDAARGTKGFEEQVKATFRFAIFALGVYMDGLRGLHVMYAGLRAAAATLASFNPFTGQQSAEGMVRLAAASRELGELLAKPLPSAQMEADMARIALGADDAARAIAAASAAAAEAAAAAAAEAPAASNAEAVRTMVLALNEQAETLGMNARQLLDYRLRALGAGDADIQRAIALQGVIEAGAKVAKMMADVKAVTKEAHEEMSVYADQAARNMQDAFEQFLFEPFQGGLKGMLRSFIDALRSMVASAAAARIFESLNIGGFLGGLFGGGGNKAIKGHAIGGSVAAGVPILVGETGRELFVPQTAGAIVPPNRMGGGVTITQVLTFGAGVSRQDLQAMMPAFVDATKAAVADGLRRGDM